jgi:AraC-like DNA-binding protein
MEIAYEYIPREYPISIHDAYHKNAADKGCYHHWHELIEIYYVVRGGVQLLVGNSTEWIYPGELGIANWCEPHRTLAFLDDSYYFVVKVDMYAPIFHQALHKTRFNHKIAGTDDIRFVIENMVKEAASPDQETQQINIGYATTLLGLICRENTKLGIPVGNLEFQYTRGVFSYIHKNYSSKFTLKEIADSIGISTPHMCRTFINHTGITINKYLNQTRCNAALQMITKGASISDAAAAVGFSDYNYFSRVFKKLMGLSPSQINKVK